MLSRLALIAFLCAASLVAQDAPFTLKVDVAMVSLDVAVFNKAGIPVTNLQQKDFQIFENGRPQEIRTFASSDTPYNMLLVVDRSGSMRTQFPLLIEAVNRFIGNMRTQDSFSLAAFDDSVHRLIEWRSVRVGTPKTVNLGSGGNTDFYKALEWASDQLKKIRGRKAVLVFSDGEDYRLYDPLVNAKAFRKVEQTIRGTKAPFHFVGLGADPKSSGAQIERLAEISGGHAYFPSSIEKVVPLYDEISRELGISYTLAYLSDRPQRDGTQRHIEVVVADKGLRVSQSRSGYSAN